MEQAKIKEIYKQTCDTKGFLPNEGQFKTWKTQFAFADAHDLESAIETWFAKSPLFPMPSDLLPAVHQLAQQRSAHNATPRYTVAWKCRVCGHTMVGYLKHGDSTLRMCDSPYGPVGSKHCLPKGQVCGGVKDVVMDGRIQGWSTGRAV